MTIRLTYIIIRNEQLEEDSTMFERLEAILERYEKINEMMADPAIVTDIKKLTELSKEQRGLEETVNVYTEYKEIAASIEDLKEMAKDSDPEISEMAEMELEELKPRLPELEERLEILLIPKDPNDEKNVIVEIRGAAGGDEANIFASDLYRMYTKYAELKGWKIQVMNVDYSESGGMSQVEFMISGESVYSHMKYESGAHRVQRVPATESQGRIHTSTATVVVMAEAEEVEVNIEEKDIRTDIYRSSGAGGQHVNKTDSAVRLTHLPTGIAVAMQDERSQLKNREKAMKVLRARVYDQMRNEIQEEYDSERKSAIGTGDRSERIRTYNYPQSRVTDHRIGLTIQKLEQILSGKLDEIIDALLLFEQTEKLENLQNGL